MSKRPASSGAKTAARAKADASDDPLKIPGDSDAVVDAMNAYMRGRYRNVGEDCCTVVPGDRGVKRFEELQLTPAQKADVVLRAADHIVWLGSPAAKKLDKGGDRLRYGLALQDLIEPFMVRPPPLSSAQVAKLMGVIADGHVVRMNILPPAKLLKAADKAVEKEGPSAELREVLPRLRRNLESWGRPDPKLINAVDRLLDPAPAGGVQTPAGGAGPQAPPTPARATPAGASPKRPRSAGPVIPVEPELLRLFREGRPLESIGPFERVGPDQFPLAANSPLKAEHEALSPMLAAVANDHSNKPKANPVWRAALEMDEAGRTRWLLALLERCIAHDCGFSTAEGYTLSGFFNYGSGAHTMAEVFEAGVDAPRVVPAILDWYTSYRFVYYGAPILEKALRWVREHHTPDTLPPELRDRLIAVRAQYDDVDYAAQSAGMVKPIDELVGRGPWNVLPPAEFWAREAAADVESCDAPVREAWWALLRHCHGATAARPSAKWLKAGSELLKAVGEGEFRRRLVAWFPRADAGRVWPLAGMSWENVDERLRMHEVNATVLRGLLWLSPAVADPELTRAVSRLAVSAYRKIRGLGPRAVKVGNAAVYALSQIGTEDAVGQLAMLKVRVKFGTAQKEVEKAFTAAAEALGLPRDQIEELGVPTYGLEEVGRRREGFGEYAAELRVDGRDADLSWTRVADGKPHKSVPAKVKAEFKEELKELQQAAKDVAAMLPAQAERIDSMFLLNKRWPLAAWRERYLDHPLVGTIGRRLIWTFYPPGARGAAAMGRAAIWHDGKFVGPDNKPFDPADGTEVGLWHPIGRLMEEVLAWRAWLQANEVRQPFKQAHREVYVLTDAERRTRTYSNRFAAHVIRQHQFNALCAARGWKNKLRLMVDDVYPPASKELPTYGLRPEYWVEGIGDNYGTDTTESGSYLRLATDQVRFYRTGAAENTAHAGGGGYSTSARGPGDGNVNEPIPLEDVPPLAFSEVMRDVDLFVGVASVGNDPTWVDGGPGGRYRDYWQNYSFGDLSETAQTRKAVLGTLLPRLKIRDRASLADRFLVVRGDLRTYKIHLGSGNILMEPNDQYLCIVPNRSAAGAGADAAVGGPLFLPFEGDSVLSLVLSKALLLADDTKIKDPTIVSQINRK